MKRLAVNLEHKLNYDNGVIIELRLSRKFSAVMLKPYEAYRELMVRRQIKALRPDFKTKAMEKYKTRFRG
ncbi:hypothetical protein EQO05_01365 [Methanosarcina sp. MSH10X1]|uniref:hypothetical protein n=1 Tax=Methanosarcina sp. MSH10X1 TaxID=2507075 RepID=UPI000FFCB2CC|nr:hypothetical protein [Methanosarcina sp. MSH10X1]RXA21903.1 hypothetical protein EQO05_01365 [Methanosarcina sp. MSH10X1]